MLGAFDEWDDKVRLSESGFWLHGTSSASLLRAFSAFSFSR
jgi:hypothetical protein